MTTMLDAAATIRAARRRSGLSLRSLAERAGTSHATVAAYESGRKVPTATTLDRLVRAAGFDPTVVLRAAVGGAEADARGRELEAALDLAAQFPNRHHRRLRAPVFGR
jgi:transcriptional regulator with XRE-family HTH domain